MVKGANSSSIVGRKGWRSSSSRWSVPSSISFTPFLGTLSSSQISRNHTATSMVDANVEDSDSSHDTNNMPTQVQRQHFYALYTFHSTRSNQQRHEDKNNKSTAGCNTKKGDGLGDEAEEEEEEDGDIEELSLSIVATDLNAGVETELRKCLVQRLSKGVDCVGSGNVVSLTSSENSEFPSVCYYCLWKSDSNPSATCGVPLLPPSSTAQSSTGDYLVCFLFSEEDSLEHFRVDLDDYSGGVLQYLDAEMEKEDAKDKLSRIDTCVKNYLQAWPVVAMDYLCRCLDVLNTSVHYLIYCALVGAQLEINGGTEQFQKDVRKFVRSCTLDGFENLHQSKDVMSNSCDSWQTLDIQPNIVPGKGQVDKGMNSKNIGHESNGNISLTLEAGDKFHFDPDSSCRFCKEWADKMVNSDRHNAVYLKVTIDSYKLQCIQHINTLNRLLKQAENDHYALYRAYVFLKNSGYGNVLLKYCQLLDLQPNDLDALRALEEFIEENNDMMDSASS